MMATRSAKVGMGGLKGRSGSVGDEILRDGCKFLEGGVSKPDEEEERFTSAGGDRCGREDSGRGGTVGVVAGEVWAEGTGSRFDWALVRTLAVGV